MSGGSVAAWFPDAFSLPQSARTTRSTQMVETSSSMPALCEPNCKGLRLNTCKKDATKARDIGGRMSWMLDGIGRVIVRYLDRPALDYEPFTPSDPDALRQSLQPGDVLLV